MPVIQSRACPITRCDTIHHVPVDGNVIGGCGICWIHGWKNLNDDVLNRIFEFQYTDRAVGSDLKVRAQPLLTGIHEAAFLHDTS